MDKIPLTQSTDASLFFFTVQHPVLLPEPPCDFHAVLAFEMVNAVNFIRTAYNPAEQIFLTFRGSMPVKNVLNVMREDLPVIVEPIKEPDQKRTHTDFINSMRLISDEFVKDEADKLIIKRILDDILKSFH